MRIISGYARGQKLATPPNNQIRPTTDRVRESLFAILGSFEEAVVLDAFAGTGALGCEALSRGAEFAYFFDRAPSAVDLIAENVARVRAEDLSRIVNVPMERGLELLDHEPDVVFLDPPYNKGLAQEALDSLSSCPKITENCLVVVEQATDETPVEHADFKLDDERVYGSTRIRMLLRRPLT